MKVLIDTHIAIWAVLNDSKLPKHAKDKEVEEAQKSPIVFDEDCGELSPAMMKAFKSAVVQRNRRNIWKLVH